MTLRAHKPPWDDPLVVPPHVLEQIREHFIGDGADQWLQRSIPAFDGLTPLEWVRQGHSWNEILRVLDPRNIELGP